MTINRAEIDKLIDEIDNEVYAQTKEKLDDYGKTLVRANVISNQVVIDSTNISKVEILASNQQVMNRLNTNLKPVNNYYDNISPSAAFWLRSGWGVWALLCTTLVVGGVLILLHGNMLNDDQQLIMDKVDATADSTGLFIDVKHYRVINDRKNGRSGIIIPREIETEAEK